jgi:hypothetical protein
VGRIKLAAFIGNTYKQPGPEMTGYGKERRDTVAIINNDLLDLTTLFSPIEKLILYNPPEKDYSNVVKNCRILKNPPQYLEALELAAGMQTMTSADELIRTAQYVYKQLTRKWIF